MSKPVFVLVPGAFHLEGCLDPLAKHINEAGYKTKTTTLKSVGNADKTLTDDIAHLRDDVLLPLVESEDVVLVIHSYAGFPGSAAIKGLGKKDRQAKGLKGGILGVIYMCAFIPKEGDHLKGMIGGQWAPWQVPDVSIFAANYRPLTIVSNMPLGESRTHRGFRSRQRFLRRRSGSCRPHRKSQRSIDEVLPRTTAACRIHRASI